MNEINLFRESLTPSPLREKVGMRGNMIGQIWFFLPQPSPAGEGVHLFHNRRFQFPRIIIGSAVSAVFTVCIQLVNDWCAATLLVWNG